MRRGDGEETYKVLPPRAIFFFNRKRAPKTVHPCSSHASRTRHHTLGPHAAKGLKSLLKHRVARARASRAGCFMQLRGEAQRNISLYGPSAKQNQTPSTPLAELPRAVFIYLRSSGSPFDDDHSPLSSQGVTEGVTG